MKIRLLSLLLMLGLLLSACAPEQPLPTAPETVDREATEPPFTTPLTTVETTAPYTREEHAVLTHQVEGESYPVAATLYRGSDYSIYIPDVDFTLESEEFWRATFNRNVTCWIMDYPDETPEALRQRLEEQGYTRLDSNTMVSTLGGMYSGITIYQLVDRVRSFCYSFPDSTEYLEGTEPLMEMIADTFVWETD